MRHLAVEHLDRFASFEPKVLKGDDPGAIHDLRVASRRLQVGLDFLIPKPQPAGLRKLLRRVKRCRRAFSEVRNCDVLISKVDSILAKKRTARRGSWTAFAHYLEERRSASFPRAMRKLGKANLARTYLRLKAYLVEDGETPEAVQFYPRVAASLEEARSILGKRLEILRRSPDGKAAHRLRISAKRLRYLIEIVHEFGVPGSAEALGWFRNLQKRLGAWHDQEVLEQLMIEMIARPEYLGEHLDIVFEVERLIVRNRQKKQSLVAAALEMIADTAEFRQTQDWLEDLIASPPAAFAKA